MESDSDSFIDFSDQNYIDNDDDQELQNSKSNLIEQIENFRYEVSKRYNKEHELFTKLHILEIEVESEYVTRENLKVYCDILCELVKRFRESDEETKKEIKEANKELEDELQKLTEKAKKIQEIEQIQEEKKKTEDDLSEKEKKSEQKSSGENDFDGFFWSGAFFGIFIFSVTGYLVVDFIAASLGIGMFAAAGIFLAGFIGAAVAIGFSIWGIYKGINKGINVFINWYRDRNLCKILQKIQKIEEKIQEDANQEIQIEVEGQSSETIDKKQSLILYIRNDLLIQVVKLKNEVSKKADNEELIQKLNDLEDSIRRESSFLENLKEFNVNLFDFTKEVLKKEFSSKIKNLAADLNLGGIVACSSLSGLPIGIIGMLILPASPLAAIIVMGILMASVISALIYAGVVCGKKNRIIQICKDAENKHNKVFCIVENKDKQNELVAKQFEQQQDQSFVPQLQGQQNLENNYNDIPNQFINSDEIANVYP